MLQLHLSLFLTRRDSLGKETFHESMEFFLNFQDADIFHFVKTMVKYYREEHPPISTPKAKENEAIFLRWDRRKILCRKFLRNFRSGSAVDNLSDIAWEKWICDSVILFTENHDRENFQIPPEFLPIVRRLYDSFLQPTILRGFVDLINHIAPTVYRCFCFLVDVFELGMDTIFSMH